MGSICIEAVRTLLAIDLVTEQYSTDDTQCNNVLIVQCTMTWSESSSSSWWGLRYNCLFAWRAGGLRTPLTTRMEESRALRFPRHRLHLHITPTIHTTTSHSYSRRYTHTNTFAIRNNTHCFIQYCTSRHFQPGDGPRRPLPSTPIPIAIT